MDEEKIRDEINEILLGVGSRGWQETTALLVAVVRTEAARAELRGFEKAEETIRAEAPAPKPELVK